jgi:uroporphyrinogen decarboxylase
MNIDKPDFDRVARAVKHQEPDRVPLIDAAVSYEIMGQFLGKEVLAEDIEAQTEFWRKAGYDYIAITAGMMQPGKVTKDSFISRIIDEKVAKGEEWNLEKKGFINDIDDFDVFPWEESECIDLSKFYEAQGYLTDNMKIIALSGKIFTLSWMLMGYENFCVNLLLEYDFVKKVVDKVAHIQFETIKKVIEIPNVEAVWAVDDLAFGTGTIIKPEYFRELIFPWYKKFADECHKKGKFLFYHSDGVLDDVMEDLIGLGIDALHPIDPTCMDIEKVKREYGKRLCLFGNIPNDLLMQGTPEEIRELVIKRIKALAPGGGYCVASGNSVPDWTKLENYQAMIKTTLEYGVYPIYDQEKIQP